MVREPFPRSPPRLPPLQSLHSLSSDQQRHYIEKAEDAMRGRAEFVAFASCVGRQLMQSCEDVLAFSGRTAKVSHCRWLCRNNRIDYMHAVGRATPVCAYAWVCACACVPSRSSVRDGLRPCLSLSCIRANVCAPASAFHVSLPVCVVWVWLTARPPTSWMCTQTLRECCLTSCPTLALWRKCCLGTRCV
jgi:hypothetical protein